MIPIILNTNTPIPSWQQSFDFTQQNQQVNSGATVVTSAPSIYTNGRARAQEIVETPIGYKEVDEYVYNAYSRKVKVPVYKPGTCHHEMNNSGYPAIGTLVCT